jgi:hypothetical protein
MQNFNDFKIFLEDVTGIYYDYHKHLGAYRPKSSLYFNLATILLTDKEQILLILENITL